MALVIRLRQQGKNNRRSFRLVVTDTRSPRDGKYVEKLGFYDPLVAENNFKANAERILFWLDKGALCSERAKALIKKVAPEVIKHWNDKKRAKREKCK